jgi:hypothetical protein
MYGTDVVLCKVGGAILMVIVLEGFNAMEHSTAWTAHAEAITYNQLTLPCRCYQ